LAVLGYDLRIEPPLGRQLGKRVESLADWIQTSLPVIMDARRSLEADPTHGLRRKPPK
jgi:hypothetical protein